MKLFECKSHLGFSAIFTLSFLAAPGALVAQDAQFSMEEIIVTARKREESLQEVPVAITVFTGRALDSAGIQTTRELFANTPGLNYDTGFDQNAATPAIRGVVSTEIATYRQKVTTFFDGMPILGQQGSVPFTTIGQVEVLRGPQSAAFGRSTFGGAINYTTRDPGDTLDGDINLELGENNLIGMGATVSGPIVNGILGGLISVGKKQRSGEEDWVTQEEGISLGGEDSENALVKLVYTPMDALSLELRYRTLNVDNEQTPRAFYATDDPHRIYHPDLDPNRVFLPCGLGPNPPGTPRTAPQSPSCAYVGTVSAVENQVYDYNYAGADIKEPFVRNSRDRYEAELTYDFSDGSTLQLLGFTSDEYYERATDADLSNNDTGFERDPTNIEEAYAELRYTSKGDARFRYGGGMSWYDYDFLTTVHRSSESFDLGESSPAAQRIAEGATNAGYFFNLTYDLTDQLTTSFEGRYQDDDVSGSAVRQNEVFGASQSTKAFLPRVALTYSFSKDTTVYFQVAKGNNPAGVNAGALNQRVVDAFDAFPEAFIPDGETELKFDLEDIAFFKEEEVWSYEFGIKGVYEDKLTYAINLYALDWENYTQPFSLNFEPDDFVDDDPSDNIGDAGSVYDGLSFSLGRSFMDAGDVTGRGIEIESNYIATENLRIGLVASYIDITYDSGACSTRPLNYDVVANTTNSIGLSCVDISGRELGTQPKLSAALNLEYSKDISGGMEWFARWGVKYSGSQYVSEMNLAELDAYSISDIRTGLNSEDWRAEFYVTNLLGEDAPQGPQIFFDGDISRSPRFSQNLAYTTRRDTAFGLRLSYNFGG